MRKTGRGVEPGPKKPGLPLGLKTLIFIGHILPPILAGRFRDRFYSLERARRDRLSAVIPGLTGSALRCDSDEKITYEFMVNGYWDWRTVAAASAVCREGDVILECGANVGTETVAYSDIVGETGRVFAFEPQPENFRKLQSSVNSFRNANTEVFPLAVSDVSGELWFRPPIAGEAGGGLIDPTGTIRVSATALDDMADRFGPIRLIHMDIEGAEILALRGARRILESLRPFLIIECLPKVLARFRYSASDLVDSLSDKYHLVRIDRIGLAAISLSSNPYYNWIAIPKGEEKFVDKIQAQIRRVGLLPCIPGIHPLSRWTGQPIHRPAG